MNSSLEGKLEAVKFKRYVDKNVIEAIFKGTLYYIHGPQNHNSLRDSFLVRFSHKKENKKNVVSANFVTSAVPIDFQGLSNNDYILLGLWKEYMEKEGGVPNIQEVDKYYDPRGILLIYYLTKNSAYNKGRYKIWNDGKIEPRKQTFSYIVRRGFFDNPRYARVVISESMDQLQTLSKISYKNKIVPILMEPIM